MIWTYFLRKEIQMIQLGKIGWRTKWFIRNARPAITVSYGGSAEQLPLFSKETKISNYLSTVLIVEIQALPPYSVMALGDMCKVILVCISFTLYFYSQPDWPFNFQLLDSFAQRILKYDPTQFKLRFASLARTVGTQRCATQKNMNLSSTFDFEDFLRFKKWRIKIGKMAGGQSGLLATLARP